MKDHAQGRGNTPKKNFSQVSYVDNLPNRRARNLEGSALFHDRGKTLYNTPRPVTPGYYHSYNPKKLGEGRTFMSQADIDKVMEKGKTVQVDGEGKVKCPG